MTDQFVLMLLLAAQEPIENPKEYVQQHQQIPTHQAQRQKPPKLQRKQKKKKNTIHQPR